MVPRIRLNLDGNWDFFPDPQQRFDPDLAAAGAPRRIRVPGPWQAQFDDMRDYTGVAWYRVRFELPPTFAQSSVPDPTYILHFGAVDYFTTVWLNGIYIDVHEGGYLPFELVLDKAIHTQGTNELLVRVLDPGAEGDLSGETEAVFDEIPHGKQSWYGPISGIWQSVYLEKRNATYIEQLHITPDLKAQSAKVEVELNRPVQHPRHLELTLSDPNGDVREFRFELDAGHPATFETTLAVPDPLLWDILSPYLYNLKVRLIAPQSRLLDEVSAKFGMRSIAATPDGHLQLNGRTLYLRGALDQDYYPDLIYTPFSDDELDRQFAQAKHMGLNCLRTHIKITDPRYYDAADRMGILIWTELPNWENLTPMVRPRVRETLAGMIARDWNHPSIIIWTLVNESWGVDLANADHRKWLAETYDYIKDLDPNRLVVGNSACFSNFHVVTDIQDFHNYYSIPDHYHEWRSWVENFAARPSWVYAHEYKSIADWRAFLKDPWNPAPRTLAPEVRRTGSEPMVISEFGNWGLPDVQALRACYGNQEPWWFETGMEWGDGATYPHAVEQRFQLWRLDKIFGTLKNLAETSQWMQFKALKYQIEQIRLHPSIVGYVITEFTDVHWESNGLLDMCRNPKVFYDSMAEINGADALIPSWRRISYWENEPFAMQLVCSHFSERDLEGSCVEWELKGFPLQGTLENLHPGKASITRLGEISFRTPELETSAAVQLEFRLYDAQGALVTRNELELYVFPRHLHRAAPVKVFAEPEWRNALRVLGYSLTDTITEADVIVAATLTDDLRALIQRGARVLWMAENSDSQQTALGTIEIAPRKGRRWQGDWATNFNWIRHDELFSDIPTHNTVDFCFADLTPETVIIGFPARDFNVDVHAGLFVGWIHHTVALIGERRFGNGLVMISTFRLLEQITADEQNPVATIMLHDMIAHLARERVYSPNAPGNAVVQQ